ncbi:MAG: DUF1566 domain-containing protein [Leptonema sp. (in: Bacteria)]|nr:DUF1566 domain-containing protein [Leptonema sp. (in: bacteria)]
MIPKSAKNNTKVVMMGNYMQKTQNCLFSFLVIAFSLLAIECSNPKDKEKKLDSGAQLSVILSFHDNGNGIVTGPDGLLWMKCAIGQVWDSSLNTCTGTGGGTTFGARSMKFCEVAAGCVSPATLVADSGPAFNACNTVTVGGLTGWRLPTKFELANLGSGMDRPTMLMIFPQTPDDKEFWSASQDENDANLARAMSFSGVNFGKEYGRQKTDVKYVKCVR